MVSSCLDANKGMSHSELIQVCLDLMPDILKLWGQFSVISSFPCAPRPLLSPPAELPQFRQLPRDPGLPAPEGGWAQGLEEVLLLSSALRALLLHKGHLQGKAEPTRGRFEPLLPTGLEVISPAPQRGTAGGVGLKTSYGHRFL